MAADLFRRAGVPSDRDEPGFRITLADLRGFVTRGRWVIAGVFALTVLSAYAALSLTTEVYEAQAALLVKLGRENLDPPPTARNMVLSTGVRREELGSEVQILRSTDLLAQVVDELGVEAFRVRRVPPDDLLGKVKFYVKAGLRWGRDQAREALIVLDLKKRLTEREQAVALLVDGVVAEPQKDSDVLAIRLQLADPQLAVRVIDTLIRRYMARRIEVRQSPGVKEFFDRETGDLRAALDRAEAARNRWKMERNLTAPAEQKALLLQQIRQLSAERARAVSEGEALSRQVTTARQMIIDAPERVQAAQVETANPSTRLVRERLTKLETDRAHLLATYKPDAAPVKILDDEIASLRGLAGGAAATELGSVTSEVNPLRRQLEQVVNQDTVRLEGLHAALDLQDQQLGRLEAELRTVEEGDATLGMLERERSIAEQNYLAAVKRQKDADIQYQLDLSRITNVSVAMPPAATVEPVAPRKLLIMALALAVGLVLGIAAAIVGEWTSDTLHDAEDVESETELVCLGAFGVDWQERRVHVAE